MLLLCLLAGSRGETLLLVMQQQQHQQQQQNHSLPAYLDFVPRITAELRLPPPHLTLTSGSTHSPTRTLARRCSDTIHCLPTNQQSKASKKERIPCSTPTSHSLVLASPSASVPVFACLCLCLHQHHHVPVPVPDVVWVRCSSAHTPPRPPTRSHARALPSHTPHTTQRAALHVEAHAHDAHAHAYAYAWT